MANPTTNYGWVMPNSADLVTDLPADFAVFGQGVDTSMQYLLGGTTGQVLSKTSATNMAFTWTTPTDQVPLTTKGDLFTFTTVDARLGVGSNNQTLYADSTALTGLAWGASAKSTLTTTGDIIYASAANTPARLGIGSSAQVLSVSGGIPAWSTLTNTSKIGQVITATYSTQYANATTTYGDTGLTATITPTAASSKIFVIITQPFATIKNTITAVGGFWEVLRDATSLGITAAEQSIYMSGASGNLQISILGWSVSYMDSPSSTSALVYKTQIKADAASTTVYTSTGSRKATITLMEILA